MLRVMFTLLVLVSAGLTQTSSDGSFSVRHSKDPNFSLSPAQMREAESLYQSARATVQHDFHTGAGELHPHFTVIIGTDINRVLESAAVVNGVVNGKNEIWLKKWDPVLFAEGVVVLAFRELLTDDVIKQLGDRAVRLSSATVDVAGLK